MASSIIWICRCLSDSVCLFRERHGEMVFFPLLRKRQHTHKTKGNACVPSFGPAEFRFKMRATIFRPTFSISSHVPSPVPALSVESSRCDFKNEKKIKENELDSNNKKKQNEKIPSGEPTHTNKTKRWTVQSATASSTSSSTCVHCISLSISLSLFLFCQIVPKMNSPSPFLAPKQKLTNSSLFRWFLRKKNQRPLRSSWYLVAKSGSHMKWVSPFFPLDSGVFSAKIHYSTTYCRVNTFNHFTSPKTISSHNTLTKPTMSWSQFRQIA